ncbi:hypothetical protein NDU88_007002 [Pleurodeles waltl]|uniref:Uncharacterized protein n=1 Tax=Pleurodeles waltl TaxID=8319 RepID=A0AAV7UMN5_PLEWA|nr:hypothetical protein NDU88_007002 [Pleurodeles waltl]
MGRFRAVNILDVKKASGLATQCAENDKKIDAVPPTWRPTRDAADKFICKMADVCLSALLHRTSSYEEASGLDRDVA